MPGIRSALLNISSIRWDYNPRTSRMGHVRFGNGLKAFELVAAPRPRPLRCVMRPRRRSRDQSKHSQFFITNCGGSHGGVLVPCAGAASTRRAPASLHDVSTARLIRRAEFCPPECPCRGSALPMLRRRALCSCERLGEARFTWRKDGDRAMFAVGSLALLPLRETARAERYGREVRGRSVIASVQRLLC